MGDAGGPGCSDRSSSKHYLGLHRHDVLLTWDFQSLRILCLLWSHTRCYVGLDDIKPRKTLSFGFIY